jgi:uncharacterized membrane protein YeaQ/YmgE (transglycosylase-associated protein family)
MHPLIDNIIAFGLFISDRRQNSALAFFGWFFMGIVAGYVVSKLMNRQGHGTLFNMLLGIVGALVGGFLANLFRDTGVENLNPYSFFVAFISALVFLIIYHARFLAGAVRQRRS